MAKVGRNEPCPCGSGKKFKKCCEEKMIGKRFMATKIDTSSGSVNSLFKNVAKFSFPGSSEKKVDTLKNPSEDVSKDVISDVKDTSEK